MSVPAPTDTIAGQPLDASPILVGGKWEADGTPLTLRRPGSGEVVGSTFEATAEQRDAATAAAVEAFRTTRRLPAHERREMLQRVADGLIAVQEPLARLMAAENGKPLRDCRTEVARTAGTFRISGEEAERIGGEVMPLDLLPTTHGRFGITRRVPLGPVAGITPFNVPLSLASHKLGPALAAGDSIVLKPDSRVALSALVMARVMEEAGVPAGAVSMLPMDREVGDGLVTDDRFRLLSFTGSARVGWDMRARAGTKKVALELGGNAALIVDETADVGRAVARTVAGGFKYAGQLCISVQRVLVHDSRYDEFVDGLVAGAARLRVGDPLEEDTDLGPMISEQAAEQALAWVEEATDRGATVLTGGTRRGAYVDPIVVADVPADVRLTCEEAFAPVVTVAPFTDLDDAVATVNDSRYGLQAGVFTNDLQHVLTAFESLEMAGVVVNDVPTFRVDSMPYGGTKDSGLGREGVRYALEDMTDLRLLVMTPDQR